MMIGYPLIEKNILPTLTDNLLILHDRPIHP